MGLKTGEETVHAQFHREIIYQIELLLSDEWEPQTERIGDQAWLVAIRSDKGSNEEI